MVTYIYFVKCPNCEDEHFDFFDEAREYALGRMGQKPIITQVEVERNDFGECTDSHDLGTVWSWEDMMRDTEPTDTSFSKNETFGISEGLDDFDDFDIGPQIDEFDNSLDFDFEDVSTETLWVAENLNGGEIVAACWADSEDLAHRLLSQAFRERTSGDLKDCYIREAEEGEETDYVLNNTNLLAECNFASTGGKSELTEAASAEFIDLGDGCKMSREAIYDTIAVNKNDIDIPVGDLGLTHVSFNDGGYYSDTTLNVSMDRGIFYITEWHQSDDGDLAEGDSFEFRTFEEFWDKLTSYVDVEIEECARKPIPEGMTIEQLVEEMEANEELIAERSLDVLVKDSINHLVNDLGKDSSAEDFADDVILDIEHNYDTFVPETPENYSKWASAIAGEVSRQLNNPDNLTEASLSDIAAAANSEFGTGYNERDILDAAGIEDGEFFDSIETQNEIAAEAQRKHRGQQIYAIKKAIAEREANGTRDIGNDYDGGYPESAEFLPEVDDAIEYPLTLCPECGRESFHQKSCACISCGFNALAEDLSGKDTEAIAAIVKREVSKITDEATTDVKGAIGNAVGKHHEFIAKELSNLK